MQKPLILDLEMGIEVHLNIITYSCLGILLFKHDSDFLQQVPNWSLITMGLISFLYAKLFRQEYYEADPNTLQINKCSGSIFSVSKKPVLNADNIYLFAVDFISGKHKGHHLVVITSAGKKLRLSDYGNYSSFIEKGEALSQIFSKPFKYKENGDNIKVIKSPDGNLKLDQKSLPAYLKQEINWQKMITIIIGLVVGFIIMMTVLLPN